eukprot:1387476-Pyramimonas_sp.AAC.1
MPDLTLGTSRRESAETRVRARPCAQQCTPYAGSGLSGPSVQPGILRREHDPGTVCEEPRPPTH